MDSLNIFKTILSWFSLPFPDYPVISLMDTPSSMCLLPILLLSLRTLTCFSNMFTLCANYSQVSVSDFHTQLPTWLLHIFVL